MEKATDSTAVSSTGISWIQKWGHVVQAVGAIAVVVVAVVAINIERNIADVRAEREKQRDEEIRDREVELERQEEQRRREEARRAAIDRSIALYNYFMTSENTKKLMTHHVNINRIHSHNKGENTLTTKGARATFVGAILESIKTKDEHEEVYRMLALSLNDIVPILRCGKFKDEYWTDSTFPEKHEYERLDGDDLPLCDRETFRTILLGPVSELFFSFRYFFYCEDTLRAAYLPTMTELEVTIADYVYHDNASTRRIPRSENFVFREDRDKEIAIQSKAVTKKMLDDHALPVIRLRANSPECGQFTSGFRTMNDEKSEKHFSNGT